MLPRCFLDPYLIQVRNGSSEQNKQPLSHILLRKPPLDFLVSRCALDASKTLTKLVSAISGPFLEASGEPFSSKLAPEIPDGSAA